MNKLPKSVEKRFNKKFSKRQVLGFSGPYHKDEVKQFLADELARQREEIINRLAHTIASMGLYKKQPK